MTKGAPTESNQSLRFNDDDAAYLSWTPASAGNRKTWTWSGWVKRGNLGTTQTLFEAASGSAPYTLFWFYGDTLNLSQDNGAGGVFYPSTNAVFRDVSAWYHIVLAVDTTQATSTDRIKIYVNGDLQTITNSYPSLNLDTWVNHTYQHRIGYRVQNAAPFDGYLSEVNFVDGLALDPTSFGETDDNGQWVPIIEPDVTYGTNGFYLPFTNDYSVEGFNTVTYRGNGGTQYVGGVGFDPDMVWIKERNGTYYHRIFDTVRGVTKEIFTNGIDAESTTSGSLTAFNPDGFTLGSNGPTNQSGSSFVAWSWDMGTGSPVSNTDGSITSTVKANPAYGQSIVSYTGNGSSGSVGHGLSATPEVIIVKNRSNTADWPVYFSGITSSTETVRLNSTLAKLTGRSEWNSTLPTSSVFSVGNDSSVNTNTDNYVAYCFHSVAGYSDFGFYTGNGSTTGPVVTTGFKPAFVMVKATSTTGGWRIWDATRNPTNPIDHTLHAHDSTVEDSYGSDEIDFLSDGFQPISTGSWQNSSGVTYIYMAFADKREAAFWLDQSGNNNDWTNNNMQESDISLDSPLNNFATANVLTKPSNVSYSEGNLKCVNTSNGDSQTESTIFVSTGKWYAEMAVNVLAASSNHNVGVTKTPQASAVTASTARFNGNGNAYKYGTNLGALGTTFAAGDILGMAYNADDQEFTLYKNNTLIYTITGLDNVAHTFYGGAYATNDAITFNFGQDSSFAGNKVAQGYQDANGIGDFYYEPPAGYLALCTDNLPDPAIADPSEHFNTVLYTGNASTQSITGVGFQPDFTWIKTRSIAYYHRVFDSVRGVANGLYTNATSAEATYASLDGVTSFDADGFSLDSKIGTNENSASYVAWNWKADNTSGTTNTDGSITSTVSANTTAGFSIVGYTGNGISGSTVGHGLTQFPQLILQKNRSAAIEWASFTTAIDGSYDYFYLDLANAAGNGGPDSNSSTVFTVYDNYTNQSGANHIAYCFHSVESYSKIGSFIGNGSTDGPFVYTGFRPAFVMLKRTDSAANWTIIDNTRSTYNVVNKALFPDLSIAEQEGTSSGYTMLDFLSNGFKYRQNTAAHNASGGTYIYMAFAENPFKYSNAR